MSNYKLIGVGTNAKTIKGDGDEYLTGILYMTPWKVTVNNKTFNSCSMAEQAGCIKACLNTAGRGAFTNVQAARQRKAQWFYSDRDTFMVQMVEDCEKFVKYCTKKDIQPVVRPNGTTDIRWELIKCIRYGVTYDNLMLAFPEIQFYDYTKIANRKITHLGNYHMTWSYSGANEKYSEQMSQALNNGMNIAVVFRKPNVNTHWKGLPIIDGDKDDLRIKDAKGGHIVALYAKGRAKKDTSGFVVDIAI